TTNVCSPRPSCIFPISRRLVKKWVTPIQGFTYAFDCVTFVDGNAHAASHLTARSHADTHITHRVAPSCACPGRPHRKPPACRKGSHRRRTTRREMDHHARTHCHRLYVYRQHRDRVDLTAARLVDDAHVTTRRATACDCISILSRTGPKIPQVLQQPVCDRSEWNHRRRTSKNSY